MARRKHVEHAALERWSEDSYWKRKCPACPDGVLPVTRSEDLQLQAEDRCCGCGQVVVYDDIDRMRRIDKGEEEPA